MEQSSEGLGVATSHLTSEIEVEKNFNTVLSLGKNFILSQPRSSEQSTQSFLTTGRFINLCLCGKSKERLWSSAETRDTQHHRGSQVLNEWVQYRGDIKVLQALKYITRFSSGLIIPSTVALVLKRDGISL